MYLLKLYIYYCWNLVISVKVTKFNIQLFANVLLVLAIINFERRLFKKKRTTEKIEIEWIKKNNNRINNYMKINFFFKNIWIIIKNIFISILFFYSLTGIEPTDKNCQKLQWNC